MESSSGRLCGEHTYINKGSSRVMIWTSVRAMVIGNWNYVAVIVTILD